MVGFETVDTKLKGSWTVIQKSADAESKVDNEQKLANA